MPDYDAKNIPVLDDVIENGSGEKIDFDLSIEEPDDEDKENNLDLFAGETFDLAIEDTDIESAATETPIIEVETAAITASIIDIEYTINPAAEPQIGVIEKLNDEVNNDVTLYEPALASEDEAEEFESALIDYTAVDQAETPTIDVAVIDNPTEDQPLEISQQSSSVNLLQSVTDDIVKQLMPELEQQLRLLLEQAL
ncbi:MAG: hypothetical protein ACNYZG_04090, partial [Gammaproteobacteria bacterium]